MPSYTHEEKIAILVHKGITEADAEDMIKAYQALHAKALQEQGTPLCFRDLLKLIPPTIAASQRTLGGTNSAIDFRFFKSKSPQEESQEASEKIQNQLKPNTGAL